MSASLLVASRTIRYIARSTKTCIGIEIEFVIADRARRVVFGATCAVRIRADLKRASTVHGELISALTIMTVLSELV